MLEETINCAINAALASLTYHNFAQITNFTNAASGAVKNICATFNNSLYTLISPYLNDMKIVGKTYGFATIAAFGFDVFMDYNNYGKNSNDLAKALTVTTIAAVSCVIIGAALPQTLMGLTLGIAFGVVIGVGSSDIKKNWIGY